MQAKEKLEKPLKWFVLPNESYKWDFILESTSLRTLSKRPLPKAWGLNNSLMMALTRTTSSRTRDENNETATIIERQSNIFFAQRTHFCFELGRSAPDGSTFFALSIRLDRSSLASFFTTKKDDS